MRNKNRDFWLKVTFSLIGAIAGFIFWKFAGYTSAANVIKTVWYYSILWGMALGYLLGDLVSSYLIKRENKYDSTV